ncbi:MAG: hypothetical protein ACLFSM_06525 [Thermoplasmata archaeon]
MSSRRCPDCGKEMEDVVGFSGYVWCRDCHITENIDDDREVEETEECSEEIKA